MPSITSPQNPLIKHIAKLQKESRYRHECQSIVLEGKHLVSEALKREVPIKNLILEEGLSLETSLPSHTVPPSLMTKISSVKSPEGFIAEVEMPQTAKITDPEYVIALDNISDPQNVGAILRTAYALGFCAAFLAGSCADPFNPRTLRASMGASLYFPFIKGDLGDLKAFIHRYHLTTYVADAKGKSLTEYTYKKPTLIVVGNETHGSSLIDNPNYHPISIPIERIDSLNAGVAASILMFHLKNSSQ